MEYDVDDEDVLYDYDDYVYEYDDVHHDDDHDVLIWWCSRAKIDSVRILPVPAKL